MRQVGEGERSGVMRQRLLNLIIAENGWISDEHLIGRFADELGISHGRVRQILRYLELHEQVCLDRVSRGDRPSIIGVKLSGNLRPFPPSPVWLSLLQHLHLVGAISEETAIPSQNFVRYLDWYETKVFRYKRAARQAGHIAIRNSGRIGDLIWLTAAGQELIAATTTPQLT